MSMRSLVAVILGFGLLITAWQTFFIVGEAQQALIVRLGQPVRVINAPGGSEGPGLYMKQPFVENVVMLDRRNIAQEAAQEEIIAADLQRLVVDAFIRYRISDPKAYYTALRDENTAADRLERLMNSSLRQVLGSATQKQIISERRGELMQQIKADMIRRAAVSKLGIEVIDLRIKRADLPTDIQESVYNRMRTSREQEAAQKRAEGEQQKREITAQADKEVTITIADARQKAGQTLGAGDAARTRILGQSYGRDASFAAFYRSMHAYEAAIGDGKTTMVLSPDSAFFRYFERGPTGRR